MWRSLRWPALLCSLLCAAVQATERIPAGLLEELSAPSLDSNGCSRRVSANDFQRDPDGRLNACGETVNGTEDGYWMFEEGLYRSQGWFRAGQQVGTWIAIYHSGGLAAVWRFDRSGKPHGISYGLAEDGRLNWKQINVRGRSVFECGERWRCLK
jgi:CubicO group peptidase (beta-lactamase class C family)